MIASEYAEKLGITHRAAKHLLEKAVKRGEMRRRVAFREKPPEKVLFRDYPKARGFLIKVIEYLPITEENEHVDR